MQGVRRINADRNALHDHGPDNRGNAPRPANFEAMCAAFRDPAAWQREVEEYNRELVASGQPTVPPVWAEENRRSISAGEGSYHW